jgi:hypothetical protein
MVMGWVTENQFWKEGAALGYYPIVTLPQVRHIDNMGGYSSLMVMEIKDAEDLADEGARLHTQWVGAEPFFTQAAARIGYLGDTTDADYSSYVGGLMLAGGHRQRRIRPAVNFRQRYCAAADDGTAWETRLIEVRVPHDHKPRLASHQAEARQPPNKLKGSTDIKTEKVRVQSIMSRIDKQS